MRTIIISAALLIGAVSSHASDHVVRAMPSAGDREQPDFVVGLSKQHWLSSKLYWSYNPANQPAGLTTEAVVDAIKLAASRWNGMCNVGFVYLGTTTDRPYGGDDASVVDSRNVIGWDQLTKTDSDTAAITYSWTVKDTIVDADIAINTNVSFPWTVKGLDGVLTHELGHAIGIKHSNIVDSVMSADPYNSFEYMRVLRGDDAKACATLYGAASTAVSNRTFNWAEEAYPEFISPGPSVSGTYQGYYYRYYPGTNTYLGSRDGTVYFMDSSGLIHAQNSLDFYTPWVNSWGY